MLDRADLPAQLEYRSGDFVVIRPGHFVFCAVTGRRIVVEELRYWCAERQEAYSDAASALARLGERR